MLRAIIIAVLLGFSASAAQAQNVPVYQSGLSVTRGHAAMWSANGAISDAGGAAGSATLGSKYLTELGITASGLPFCINDALTNGPYHALCFGANSLGGGLISLEARGGASATGLSIDINGTIYPFPGAGNGNVVAPVSPYPTAGDIAVWNGTTTLKDGGLPANAVLTLAGLQAAATATYPNGVWRKYYATAGDAPPLFYLPNVGVCSAQTPAQANDGGACVNTTAGDGNSWSAVFDGVIDVREFGLTSSGDGTAAIQAATKAAYINKIKHVLEPIAANYTTFTIPDGVVFECGGSDAPLTRTAVGPGAFLVYLPTDAYPTGGVSGTMKNCRFEGGGLAGANVMFTRPGPATNASAYSVVDVSSFNTDTAAAFVVGSISGTTLTVTAAPWGTVHAGQMVQCGPCGYPNVTNNTYAIINPFGTSGTTGGGGTGTYSLTVSFVNTVPSQTPIWTVTPFTWAAAANACSPTSNCNTVFPSANAYVFGAAGPFNWTGGFVGGTPNGGSCTSRSGLGLVLDSPQKDGGNKPNNGVYTNVSDICNIVGLDDANGSDNSWYTGEHQNDIIAEVYGMGASNSFRNQGFQRYYEPGNDVIGYAGFIFGQNGTNNTIWGVGSLGASTFIPTVLDYGTAAGNTCLKNNTSQCNSQNRVIFPNIGEWRSHNYTTSFNQDTNPSGNGVNSGSLPIWPWQDAIGLDADDVRSAASIVKTYQAGNIPSFMGIFQRGAHNAQAAVTTGDVLSMFGGMGQTNATANAYSYTGGYDHPIPPGYAAVVAAGTFTASSYPTQWDFYTTPSGSTTPVLRLTIAKDGSFVIPGTTDGTLTLLPQVHEGSGQVTLPGNVTGTIVTTGDSATVSNAMLATPPLSGTSSSIGGSNLAAGVCASGTATVTGAASTMVSTAGPTTYPGDGVVWNSRVSAPNTVTVEVCGIVSVTPVSSTYRVRVVQ